MEINQLWLSMGNPSAGCSGLPSQSRTNWGEYGFVPGRYRLQSAGYSFLSFCTLGRSLTTM